MNSQSHLHTHFILNIIQGNIGAFFELALGSEAKRLASQGTIKLTFYQPALARLQGFEAKVLELFQQDLETRLKPITYTTELAAVCRPVAPRRAPPTAVAPKAKRVNNTSPLLEAEFAKAAATGFLRKCINPPLPTDWRLFMEKWEVPNQCPFYITQGFYCKHGACGTIYGNCPRRHRKWAQLQDSDRATGKALMRRFPGAVTMDKHN